MLRGAENAGPRIAVTATRSASGNGAAHRAGLVAYGPGEQSGEGSDRFVEGLLAHARLL